MKKIYTLALGAFVALSGFGTANAQKTVPYSSPIAVSSSAFDEGWSIIDANNDGNSSNFGVWGPASKSGSSNPNPAGFAARYYNSSTYNKPTADDYLVSPAIHLEGGQEYKILYGFAVEGSSHPKDLKVFASTTNSAEAFQATEPLETITGATNNNFEIRNITFAPQTDGDYYFAFYHDGATDGWYLFLSTFNVYKNEFTPGPVTNLAVERDKDRAVKATLTWTLPTKSVFGDEFTEEQTFEAINIYRDGFERTICPDLDPTATEFVDSEEYGLTAGIHTYEVEVVVAGKKSAKTSVTSKYIGPVTPATLPYTWEPSSQDAFDDWTILIGDDAETTVTWTYYDYYKAGRFSNVTGKKEANYFVATPFAGTKPRY